MQFCQKEKDVGVIQDVSLVSSIIFHYITHISVHTTHILLYSVIQDVSLVSRLVLFSGRRMWVVCILMWGGCFDISILLCHHLLTSPLCMSCHHLLTSVLPYVKYSLMSWPPDITGGYMWGYMSWPPDIASVYVMSWPPDITVMT